MSTNYPTPKQDQERHERKIKLVVKWVLNSVLVSIGNSQLYIKYDLKLFQTLLELLLMYFVIQFVFFLEDTDAICPKNTHFGVVGWHFFR